MATIQDIITAALRRINAVGVAEVPSADESADALDYLNDYMAEWPGKDWDVLDSLGNAYTHTPLSLTDTWPLDDKFLGSIKAILAARLAERYGSPVTQELRFAESRGVNMLAAAFHPGIRPDMPSLLKNVDYWY